MGCAAAVIVRSVKAAKGSSPNRAIDILAALATAARPGCSDRWNSPVGETFGRTDHVGCWPEAFFDPRGW
jgi:hypothetical protein